jgi:hypothetical protein
MVNSRARPDDQVDYRAIQTASQPIINRSRLSEDVCSENSVLDVLTASAVTVFYKPSPRIQGRACHICRGQRYLPIITPSATGISRSRTPGCDRYCAKVARIDPLTCAGDEHSANGLELATGSSRSNRSSRWADHSFPDFAFGDGSAGLPSNTFAKSLAAIFCFVAGGATAGFLARLVLRDGCFRPSLPP